MDKTKLERLELLEKAMERLGRFGRLFVDYKGCPRGPRGELGDVPGGKHILLNEDPIVDVEGDTWIPVYAKDLYRYIDKHQWIPVNERLPQELSKDSCEWSERVRPSVDVLVKTKGSKWLYTAWYSHSHKDWIDVREEHCFNNVTHWMPLPEPPKD